MQIKPGTRLRSQVGQTQVVIVRAATEDLELGCGGLALVALDDAAALIGEPSAELAEGTPVGKRYTDDAGRVEVLISKPGVGTLTLDGVALVIKGATPLPASD